MTEGNFASSILVLGGSGSLSAGDNCLRLLAEGAVAALPMLLFSFGGRIQR